VPPLRSKMANPPIATLLCNVHLFLVGCYVGLHQSVAV
jgi:hypothetical protein